MKLALRSRDDNIINWRLHVPFFHWLDNQPRKALTSLRKLWIESDPIEERLAAFVERLTEAGIRQPGAQLVISSTLLMAISPQEFPPVRMEAFKSAMDLAGRESLYTEKGTVERYLLARTFMDWMIDEAKKYEITLRDPLDAQGVIWCLSDGWRRIPVPPDWSDDPQNRQRREQLEYSKDLEDLSHEAGANDLTPTERDALVKASRGQGKFRDGVLTEWGELCRY